MNPLSTIADIIPKLSTVAKLYNAKAEVIAANHNFAISLWWENGNSYLDKAPTSRDLDRKLQRLIDDFHVDC